MNNSRLSTIFIIVFIDLLGFSLILPLLPYYAEEFGASAAVVGLLVASYAAASFIGSPILGRLSDRFGRRPVLMVSVVGTLAGFLILGFAVPIGRWLAILIAPTYANAFILGTLFVSRILDGLTGGNITVAQAYISDVTDEKTRAKGLGLIGAAFGLGFIIGPAVGGLLSKWGYHIPAFAAALISFLNLIQIFLLLPESLTKEQRLAAMQQQSSRELNRPLFSFDTLFKALKRPKVGPLLNVRFFFGLAFAVFQSIFSLYVLLRFGLDAQKTGFILAYVGLLSVLVQGLGVGILSKRFSENWLIITGLWLMTFSLIAWGFAPNVTALLIIMVPLAVAGGTLNTVIQSAITKAVEPVEIGGTLGISASLESISRVIAPSAGGILLDKFGTWAPGIFSAILMTCAIGFAYWRIILPKKTSPSETEVIQS